MIALHGQVVWDAAIAEQAAIAQAGGVVAAQLLTDAQRATLRTERVTVAAPKAPASRLRRCCWR